MQAQPKPRNIYRKSNIIRERNLNPNCSLTVTKTPWSQIADVELLLYFNFVLFIKLSYSNSIHLTFIHGKENHKISQLTNRTGLWIETEGTELSKPCLLTEKRHQDSSSKSDRLFESTARISVRNQKKVIMKKAGIKSRRICFTVRAANNLNNLSEEVTSSPSLNIFKRRLDRHWADLHAMIWGLSYYSPPQKYSPPIMVCLQWLGAVSYLTIKLGGYNGKYPRFEMWIGTMELVTEATLVVSVTRV